MCRRCTLFRSVYTVAATLHCTPSFFFSFALLHVRHSTSSFIRVLCPIVRFPSLALPCSRMPSSIRTICNAACLPPGSSGCQLCLRVRAICISLYLLFSLPWHDRTCNHKHSYFRAAVPTPNSASALRANPPHPPKFAPIFSPHPPTPPNFAPSFSFQPPVFACLTPQSLPPTPSPQRASLKFACQPSQRARLCVSTRHRPVTLFFSLNRISYFVFRISYSDAVLSRQLCVPSLRTPCLFLPPLAAVVITFLCVCFTLRVNPPNIARPSIASTLPTLPTCVPTVRPCLCGFRHHWHPSLVSAAPPLPAPVSASPPN